RRRERRVVPSPRSRRGRSLTEGERRGAPKGAGNVSNALRRTPIALGRHLAALRCGVFLRPRDRLLETDRGAHSRTPLIPKGFRPAFIRSTSPLPDGPTS